MLIRKMMIVALCVLLTGCDGLSGQTTMPTTPPPQATATIAAQTATAEPTPTPTPSPLPTTAEPTPTPEPTHVSLMAVGDIMFQYFEILSAYDKKTKTYDFNYSFQYINEILGSADLTMGNFECTLGGKPPYSQRKSLIFNAPDEVADTLQLAGFDVLQTANNHANNTWGTGIFHTLDLLESKGIACTGIREKAEDKPYLIADVKGVKIGIAAYTWCTRTKDGSIKLDYQKLGDDVKGLVNVFSNQTIDADLQEMAAMARHMREDGAELVVFCMHWGAEYRRPPDANQKKLAAGLAKAGVDVVIGSHPHWLQEVDLLPNGLTGGKTIVAYSLGNFFSCQRDEFKGTGYSFKYSEDSMILRLNLTKPYGGTATIESVQYLPTWTYMYTTGGRHFTILPLARAIASPEQYGLNTKAYLNQAKKSLANTEQLMADAVAKGYLWLMETD